ncbi:MAG: TonB-dependent receptor plug domain-containing protein [Crocinitomicaceae bacterium]
MKKIIFLLLLIVFTVEVNAQIVTVKDVETDIVLFDVSLISNSPSRFLETNTKGQVDITSMEGVEVIQIIKLGYTTQKLSYQAIVDSGLVIRMEPYSISGERVIISANRWKQNAGEIPFRTTSITPIEQELQNPQTAADLLGASGEVFIQKSQLGGGSPMIRGFATNRLLYAVDGVRMNTAIFRGGNIQNVISLDPFSMERTEVLFGPGSVLYGSDAIGAVMSFKTLDPQLSLTNEPLIKGSAATRYSSASSEKTLHFDFNVGWRKWALLTSVSTNDYGDLRMGQNGPEEYLHPFYVGRIDSMDAVIKNDDPLIQNPSRYQQMNLMQKVRFKPNDRWEFDYALHYSETSPYSRYDRHIRLKDGLPRYGEWGYGPQIWMMNLLSISHSAKKGVYDQMNIRGAYQFFEESRISRDFNDPSRENRIENVFAYSGNIDFTKAIGKRHTFYYGAEFVLNKVTSLGIKEDIITGKKTKGSTRYPQSSWSSTGAYLTHHYRATDKLILQSGLRYNQFLLNANFNTEFYDFPFNSAEINNGALTGSGGLIWRPSDKWSISSYLSTAFRSPNVDDIGKIFDSEPGRVIVPNPNLEAEYAYNIDLGITKVFGNFLKVDATGFFTLLDNALVRRDFTLNGQDSIMYDGELSQVQALQNAANTTVYGLQAGFEADLGRGFGMSARFNYQIGMEELNDGTISPSRHAAPFFGVNRVFYRYEKLQLEFNMQYSGGITYEDLPLSEQNKPHIYAIDENGNPYSPSWYTLNLKWRYAFAQRFVVGGGVENITDQRYRTYSSGLTAPGRNFVLSFKINF